MTSTLTDIYKPAKDVSKTIHRAFQSLFAFVENMRVNHGRFGASTKNATDRHNADAVAFDIQCGIFLISSPPENATLR